MQHSRVTRSSLWGIVYAPDSDCLYCLQPRSETWLRRQIVMRSRSPCGSSGMRSRESTSAHPSKPAMHMWKRCFR